MASNGSVPSTESLLRAATRESLHSEFTWNYAQMGAFRRALAAKAVGLDPEKFGQLPPGTSITFIGGTGAETASGTAIAPSPNKPTQATFPNWLKVAGIIGAMALSGAAGMVGGNLGTKSTSPPPAVAPSMSITPDGVIVQEQKQADGSWRTLWSLPAKQLPDGSAQTLDGRKWRRGQNASTWEETK